MLATSLWLALSVSIVVVLLAAYLLSRRYLEVVDPEEEELAEEARSKIRPIFAILIAEAFLGVGAAVVQQTPPSWHARFLTLPFLFAGQIVLFVYAVVEWWLLDRAMGGPASRLCFALRRAVKRLIWGR